MLTHIRSLSLIQAPILTQEKWLIHGFGLRGVSLNGYLEAFQTGNVVVPETKQVHGKTVHILPQKKRGLLEGDAFLTDRPGIVAFVRTADCLPVLLADPVKRVVGAVHAGWRGTAEKAVVAALEKMRETWGCEAKNIKAALGPAIGGRSYAVGEETVRVLKENGLYPGPWIEEVHRGEWYFDIAYANRDLLEDAGVLSQNRYMSLASTARDLEKFYSVRKEGFETGRQFNFIMIRP